MYDLLTHPYSQLWSIDYISFVYFDTLTIMELCDLNSSKCLNDGICVVNKSFNSTFCQCDLCHEGSLCETFIRKQTQYDTAYIYLILFITGLCLSVLNNTACLELFIGCKRIRQTNYGIYLIIYSILSLVANILLVTDAAINYYPNQLTNDSVAHGVFSCLVATVGYNMFVYLGLWFSSFVAFEHSLLIYFGCRINVTRWRSVVTVIVTFAIAIGTSTPLVVYNCDWGKIPKLKTARGFITWFYITVAIVVYVVANIIILISFTRHIRIHGLENNSFIITFLKLLYRHLFIFIPPIAYAVCYIPYTIVINTKNNMFPKRSYYQCGISIGEYIVKVLLEILTGIPFVVTWLLFVYPSKVYLTEFYTNTYSGYYLAKVILLVRHYICRKKPDFSLQRSLSRVHMIVESDSVQITI